MNRNLTAYTSNGHSLSQSSSKRTDSGTGQNQNHGSQEPTVSSHEPPRTEEQEHLPTSFAPPTSPFASNAQDSRPGTPGFLRRQSIANLNPLILSGGADEGASSWYYGFHRNDIKSPGQRKVQGVEDDVPDLKNLILQKRNSHLVQQLKEQQETSKSLKLTLGQLLIEQKKQDKKHEHLLHSARNATTASPPKRGPAHEPSFDRPDENFARSIGGKSKCLYDNDVDEIREAALNAIIARATISFLLEDYVRMEMYASDALGFSKELKYLPIKAHCHFHRGIALYHLHRFGDSTEAFSYARPAGGRYVESKEIEKWYRKAMDGSSLETPAIGRPSNVNGATDALVAQQAVDGIAPNPLSTIPPSLPLDPLQSPTMLSHGSSLSSVEKSRRSESNIRSSILSQGYQFQSSTQRSVPSTPSPRFILPASAAQVSSPHTAGFVPPGIQVASNFSYRNSPFRSSFLSPTSDTPPTAQNASPSPTFPRRNILPPTPLHIPERKSKTPQAIRRSQSTQRSQKSQVLSLKSRTSLNRPGTAGSPWTAGSVDENEVLELFGKEGAGWETPASQKGSKMRDERWNSASPSDNASAEFPEGEVEPVALSAVQEGDENSSNQSASQEEIEDLIRGSSSSALPLGFGEEGID